MQPYEEFNRDLAVVKDELEQLVSRSDQYADLRAHMPEEANQDTPLDELARKTESLEVLAGRIRAGKERIQQIENVFNHDIELRRQRIFGIRQEAEEVVPVSQEPEMQAEQKAVTGSQASTKAPEQDRRYGDLKDKCISAVVYTVIPVVILLGLMLVVGTGICIYHYATSQDPDPSVTVVEEEQEAQVPGDLKKEESKAPEKAPTETPLIENTFEQEKKLEQEKKSELEAFAESYNEVSEGDM